MKTTVSFDDVLLVPKKSDISSRSEISLESSISNTSFQLPIISSPMDTVTESGMASLMNDLGGLGIIHRYNSVEEQVELVRESVNSGASSIGAAIGVTDDYRSRAGALFDAGARYICVDVAHGHHQNVERALKSLRDDLGNAIILLAGNVATARAFEDLSSWGADAIRVGIGGGSICSTRIQTGHGVPTLQSVMDCSIAGDAALIADGGIKTAGDIVKCLAAGADFVMLGSLLAGTDTSPGEVLVDKEGSKYKVYRGMASREAQEAWRSRVGSLEGISTTISYRGSTRDILSDLARNIRSGLSYSGVRDLRSFQHSAEFIMQTPAAQIESSTHILNRR